MERIFHLGKPRDCLLLSDTDSESLIRFAVRVSRDAAFCMVPAIHDAFARKD